MEAFAPSSSTRNDIKQIWSHSIKMKTNWDMNFSKSLSTFRVSALQSVTHLSPHYTYWQQACTLNTYHRSFPILTDNNNYSLTTINRVLKGHVECFITSTYIMQLQLWYQDSVTCYSLNLMSTWREKKEIFFFLRASELRKNKKCVTKLSSDKGVTAHQCIQWSNPSPP